MKGSWWIVLAMAVMLSLVLAGDRYLFPIRGRE
jgi:hypothetical protein